jgi:hypothetical protein
MAVRITKARVQKPVVKERAGIGAPVVEKELDKPELILWVEVENRSKAKKLDYHGWDWPALNSDAISLTDEHGNKYRLHDYLNISRIVKDRAKGGAVNPCDEPVRDVLLFERPVSAATRLTLVLPSLVSKDGGLYHFEIPADAWK